jgi:hypothetical protein
MGNARIGVQRGTTAYGTGGPTEPTPLHTNPAGIAALCLLVREELRSWPLGSHPTTLRWGVTLQSKSRGVPPGVNTVVLTAPSLNSAYTRKGSGTQPGSVGKPCEDGQPSTHRSRSPCYQCLHWRCQGIAYTKPPSSGRRIRLSRAVPVSNDSGGSNTGALQGHRSANVGAGDRWKLRIAYAVRSGSPSRIPHCLVSGQALDQHKSLSTSSLAHRATGVPIDNSKQRTSVGTD